MHFLRVFLIIFFHSAFGIFDFYTVRAGYGLELSLRNSFFWDVEFHWWFYGLLLWNSESFWDSSCFMKFYQKFVKFCPEYVKFQSLAKFSKFWPALFDFHEQFNFLNYEKHSIFQRFFKISCYFQSCHFFREKKLKNEKWL